MRRPIPCLVDINLRNCDDDDDDSNYQYRCPRPPLTPLPVLLLLLLLLLLPSRPLLLFAERSLRSGSGRQCLSLGVSV